MLIEKRTQNKNKKLPEGRRSASCQAVIDCMLQLFGSKFQGRLNSITATCKMKARAHSHSQILYVVLGFRVNKYRNGDLEFVKIFLGKITSSLAEAYLMR